MMYLHYCRTCDAIRILSGHKSLCPACSSPLCELKLSFAAYTSMTQQDRNSLLFKLRTKHS